MLPGGRASNAAGEGAAARPGRDRGEAGEAGRSMRHRPANPMALVISSAELADPMFVVVLDSVETPIRRPPCSSSSSTASRRSTAVAFDRCGARKHSGGLCGLVPLGLKPLGWRNGAGVQGAANGGGQGATAGAGRRGE